MGETSDSLGKYEQSGEIKPYSELGKESEKGWDSWGSVLVTNPDGTQERASYYSDPRIIRRLFTAPLVESLKQKEPNQHYKLVDFGGGDGVMLHLINYQLRMEPNTPRVDPVLVDLDEKKLRSTKEKFPELNIVESSVTKLPFQDNSIDFGVSRQFLQYLSGFRADAFLWDFGFNVPEEDMQKENSQYQAIKEINRVLKPDAIFDLVYTGSKINSPLLRNTNRFWNKLTAARTGQSYEEVSQERQFTPGFQIEDAAGYAGFDVVENEDVNWIEWRVTPQSIFDRFQIDQDNPQNKEKIEAINQVFEEVAPLKDIYSPDTKSNEVDCIEFNGQKAVRIPVTRLLLKKEEYLRSQNA